LGYINKRESIRKVVDAVRQVLRGEIYLSPQMASQLLHRAAIGEPLDHNPIETHRKNIKTKLNLQNGAQLSRAAFQWVQEDH